MSKIDVLLVGNHHFLGSIQNANQKPSWHLIPHCMFYTCLETCKEELGFSPFTNFTNNNKCHKVWKTEFRLNKTSIILWPVKIRHIHPDLFTRNHDTNYAYEKNRYKKH